MKQSKIVHIPPIQIVDWIRATIVRRDRIDVFCFDPRVFRSQLLLESQLIIVVCKLSRFEQTANFRQPLSFCSLGITLQLLLFFSKQLSIVTRKFLQLNQEVTKVQLESVVSIVETKQALDKVLNLSPILSQH